MYLKGAFCFNLVLFLLFQESSDSESESESENPLGPELNVNASGGALVLLRNIPTECSGRDLLMVNELFFGGMVG